MNTNKYYTSKVTIRNGEYETLTNYCFTAPNMEEAENEVNESYDIGGDDFEQVVELYSLVEVTAEEYAILNRYI